MQLERQGVNLAPLRWDVRLVDDGSYVVSHDGRHWAVEPGEVDDPDVAITTTKHAWIQFLTTPPSQRTTNAPPRQLRWRLETPSLEWEFDGTFELTPAGAEETTLVYRGTMRFSDRYAGPLQPIHAEVLEEHLETLANRIAGRAARRTLAERTLGEA